MKHKIVLGLSLSLFSFSVITEVMSSQSPERQNIEEANTPSQPLLPPAEEMNNDSMLSLHSTHLTPPPYSGVSSVSPPAVSTISSNTVLPHSLHPSAQSSSLQQPASILSNPIPILPFSSTIAPSETYSFPFSVGSSVNISAETIPHEAALQLNQWQCANTDNAEAENLHENSEYEESDDNSDCSSNNSSDASQPLSSDPTYCSVPSDHSSYFSDSADFVDGSDSSADSNSSTLSDYSSSSATSSSYASYNQTILPQFSHYVPNTNGITETESEDTDTSETQEIEFEVTEAEEQNFYNEYGPLHQNLLGIVQQIINYNDNMQSGNTVVIERYIDRPYSAPPTL